MPYAIIDNREGMMKDEAWTVIYVTYDSLEAEMIKDLLESGEIPVVLRSSKVSPYPVNVGKIGEIKILVNDNDKEIAEKLIKEEIDND
jgi:Putative prokaryotic signal transducing protein